MCVATCQTHDDEGRNPIHDDDDPPAGSFSRPSSQRVVVVGAGPTGLLTAMYLARRGYNVEVHEQDPAPGVACLSSPAGHNYPMVLSSRALLAFRELNLQTSFYGPSAPSLQGTWDVVSGTLQPEFRPEGDHERNILVDRRGEGPGVEGR